MKVKLPTENRIIKTKFKEESEIQYKLDYEDMQCRVMKHYRPSKINY